EDPLFAKVRRQGLVRFGDRLPGIAIRLLFFRIGGNRLTQPLFVHSFKQHQLLVLQAGELAAINLQTVLHAVQIVLCLASLLFTHGHVFLSIASRRSSKRRTIGMLVSRNSSRWATVLSRTIGPGLP